MRRDNRTLGEPRPTAEAPLHVLAVTFLMAGSSAVLVAFADVARLFATVGDSRARYLQGLRIPSYILDEVDVNVVSMLPKFVDQLFDLTQFGSLFAFVAIAVTTTGLASLFLAALLSPAIVLASRLSARFVSPRVARWFWEAAYPLAVLVIFSIPGYFEIVYFLAPHYRWSGTIMVTAALWLSLFTVCRGPAGTARFVRLFGVGSAGVVVLAVAGLLVGGSVAGGKERRVHLPVASGLPNILLVSIDSLRADHLHCYGYPRQTSPRIDLLAKEGALYTTVVSSSSWTLPAHMTLLTALPPERHAVTGRGARASDEALFLTEVLREAGYATAGFVAGLYLDAVFGFSQGFDHYDDFTLPKLSPFAGSGTTSPASIEMTIDWLNEWRDSHPARPFFIFLHLWDVHFDYTPPPPYDSMFDPDYQGTVSADNFMHNTRVHQNMEPRDLEHVVALYDGEIRFTDHYVGKLLDHLGSLGVFDNTIVVVTADHGDEFFEHGGKGHGRTLFDELILVPLVIWFPREVPAGVIVDEQVRLMDVAPTILSLAGVERPAEFGGGTTQVGYQGRDLSRLLALSGPGGNGGLPAFSDLHGGELASIRIKPAKLIRRNGHEHDYQLYDLLSDPDEQTNISVKNPALVQSLDGQLHAWFESWGVGTTVSEEVEISPELRERLRNLGYDF